MSLNAQTLLESPDYFPLRFEGENLVFVKMTRSHYRQSIFTLPNRIVTDGNQAWSIPFSEVVAITEHGKLDLPTPSAIFQIAHCGSTLLSRALDQPDSSLVIRESFALRQFCASPVPSETDALNARKRGLATLWTLLSRRYASKEKVLLKANVPVNYALGEINELAADLNGVLLYCQFSDYLVAALKSDQRRLWAKHVVREMSPKIANLSGFSNIKLESLNAAQAIAILWLSQIRCYEIVAEQNPKLLALDSSHLFNQTQNTLAACADHFSLDINQSDVERIANGDLFSQHAKTPELGYNNQQRVEDLTQLKGRYKREIEQTLSWCEQAGFDTSTQFEHHCIS